MNPYMWSNADQYYRTESPEIPLHVVKHRPILQNREPRDEPLHVVNDF